MASIAEGMPGALLEAMAAGIPCVATQVGGIPDVLDNGKLGVLIPSEDTDALAEAMINSAKKSKQNSGQITEKARENYVEELLVEQREKKAEVVGYSRAQEEFKEKVDNGEFLTKEQVEQEKQKLKALLDKNYVKKEDGRVYTKEDLEEVVQEVAKSAAKNTKELRGQYEQEKQKRIKAEEEATILRQEKQTSVNKLNEEKESKKEIIKQGLAFYIKLAEEE